MAMIARGRYADQLQHQSCEIVSGCPMGKNRRFGFNAEAALLPQPLSTASLLVYAIVPWCQGPMYGLVYAQAQYFLSLAYLGLAPRLRTFPCLRTPRYFILHPYYPIL